MDELLKILACFGCPYYDDCEDEWEEGHNHCDEMIKKAILFVERTGIASKLTYSIRREITNGIS